MMPCEMVPFARHRCPVRAVRPCRPAAAPITFHQYFERVVGLLGGKTPVIHR
jgi:hypothetical protein